MRTSLKLGVLACLAILAVGCFETKHDYSLNPDGSGRVTYEITMQDMSAMMGAAMGLAGGAASAASARHQAVRAAIPRPVRRRRRLEDVSFSKAEDGRIKFKGTAYFKSIEKLKLHPAAGSAISFAKDDKGGLVLNLEGDKKDKAEIKVPAQMTEDEMAAKIKDGRAKYAQMKPMMTMIMSTMKMDITFHVPGTVAESTCFKKGEGGSLQILIEGAKLLETMDKVAADDAILREIVTAGESLSDGGPRTSLIMNEKSSARSPGPGPDDRRPEALVRLQGRDGGRQERLSRDAEETRP